MSTAKKEYKRITTKTLVEMKKHGEKIAMLTAYDYTMAKIVDHAGIDIILVGDSASNVMAGHETTLPITLDQMIYLLYYSFKIYIPFRFKRKIENLLLKINSH